MHEIQHLTDHEAPVDDHRREFKFNICIGARFFHVLTAPLRISLKDPAKDAEITITTTPALCPELARAIGNAMRLMGSIIGQPSVPAADPIFKFDLGVGYQIEMVPDDGDILWSLSIKAGKKEFSFDMAIPVAEATFIADAIFIAADVEACAPVPGRDFPVRKPRL